MPLDEFIIHPKENARAKSRAFSAIKVAAVMADGLYETGPKHDRPVYAVFAASEGEIRPFVANLRDGRACVPTSNSNYRRRGSDAGYEFMRSAGYRVHYQRHEEGTLATLYLPQLLELDPGMVDPEEVKFVIVPARDYLAEEAKKMEVQAAVKYARALPLVKDENEPERDYRGHVYSHWKEPLTRAALAEMVPLSYLFTLYLSNRTRAPIPPDVRFYLQFFLGCLKQGLASLSVNGNGDERKFGRNLTYKFSEEGTEEGKLAPGIAFWAKHEQVEALLASECADYFKRVK